MGLLRSGWADDGRVVYNRDVRPILSEHCFRCHGPDAAAREAELRLDERAEATMIRDGRRVIHPKNAAASELLRRVTSSDESLRMPPHESASPLNAKQIAILRKWIQQGAPYQEHWAFLPIQRPLLPPRGDRRGAANAIDYFVQAELQRHGLHPSPQATAATLIRRASFDLTGLPPSIAELDRFEREFQEHPELAYRRLVDRLLASPRFGEHWARSWLDAARYADTNGYFTDNNRIMWPWRDWVIAALNANMPFDQFTIEQLAGDLLPQATQAQRVATGFNRNHMINNETGIVEEEFRVEYVADRVDTTATVWMGLTVGCARCHDHKYDPITQKDFYQFFAFFNNVPERGLSGSSGNAAPLLRVPTSAQTAQLHQLQQDVAAAQRDYQVVEKNFLLQQADWEATALDRLPHLDQKSLVAHISCDGPFSPDAVSGSVESTEGMLGRAAQLKGNGCLQFSEVADFEKDNPFSFCAWIQPAGAGCVLSKMDDSQEMRGYDLTLRKGKAIVNLVHRWNRDAIRVTSVASIASRQWQHVMVTYDGSGKASGVRLYLDGKLQPVTINLDALTGSIRNRQPLRIGRRQASASFSGLIDEVQIHGRSLTSKEAGDLAASQMMQAIIPRAAENRTTAQSNLLRRWFSEHVASEEFIVAEKRLKKLQARLDVAKRSVPTTMVMDESTKRRPTHVLMRGEYDAPGEQVSADVPAFLRIPSAESEETDVDRPKPRDRRDLAKWLVSPSHPLTARVAVNRLWQRLFGQGIVKTSDDFGTQGDWPSHPEMLDWLSAEFIESGWDVKHLLRKIVTSATYQQAAVGTPQQWKADLENRLLSRGPQRRLSAEAIRDNALAISGLLVERTGGPSVRPYQPAGLWEEVTYDGDLGYQQDQGAALYRRSLYTFWKRQSPPPNLRVFDAPTRETCTIQRDQTNTPLQALVLMNDPTFIVASRNLAERLLVDVPEVLGDSEPDRVRTRIQRAFRAVTSRRPSADEVQILERIYREQLRVYRASPAKAIRLMDQGLLDAGASKDSRTPHPDPSNSPIVVAANGREHNAVELATWTTVSSMLFCLHETITKP